MIHINGFLKIEDDGWGWTDNEIEILCSKHSYYRSLAKVIAEHIIEESGTSSLATSELDDIDKEFEIGIDVSLNIPKVAMRIYYADEECSLEKAETNFILSSIGCLDIYQVSTGYSEWTILGYDVQNFKLISKDGGGHDLKEIFKTYIGKYVHILIDILSYHL